MLCGLTDQMFFRETMASAWYGERCRICEQSTPKGSSGKRSGEWYAAHARWHLSTIPTEKIATIATLAAMHSTEFTGTTFNAAKEAVKQVLTEGEFRLARRERTRQKK